MSCSFIIIPVVIGAWPLISAAIVGAGAALGYQAVRFAEETEGVAERADDAPFTLGVDLVMDDSQVVADTLMRGESFVLRRGDVTARFRVDGRGCCTVHVEGENKTIAELEAAGRELMGQVRQQFAYAKVMAELEQRGFQVTQQQIGEDRSIRLRVRRAG